MLINYYFACLDVQDLLNNHNTQFSAFSMSSLGTKSYDPITHQCTNL